jgi:hypothetical protein
MRFPIYAKPETGEASGEAAVANASELGEECAAQFQHTSLDLKMQNVEEDLLAIPSFQKRCVFVS